MRTNEHTDMSALLYYENSWFAWLGFLIWGSSMISMILLYIMNGIDPHLSPAAATAVPIGLSFALATPISLINAYVRNCS
jgi:multisubunit Na+/H+ antiporter MnhB subunit